MSRDAIKVLLRAWYSRTADFTTKDVMGPFWGRNVAPYRDRYIFSETDFADDLNDLLSRTDNYSLLTYSPDKTYAPEAYHQWLSSQPGTIAKSLFSLAESALVRDDLCYFSNGQRRSLDLDRRICHVALLEQFTSIGRAEPGDRHTVLEVGAGHGALARVLKSRHPHSTYIISDLPETLYFSAGFLMLNFPEARVLLVDRDNAGQLKDAASYDFILVPVGLHHPLAETKIDLLINTHSFGEMSHVQVRQWFQFINQGCPELGQVFLINRFLNQLGTSLKDDGNEGSISLSGDWRIRYWDFNPQFLQSPFERAREPFYLCVIADRQAQDRQQTATLARLYQEPWFAQYGKIDPDLFRPPVAVQSGTLFDLWDICRGNEPEALFLMLLYMRSVMPHGVFEEYPSFRHRLLDQLAPAARTWLLALETPRPSDATNELTLERNAARHRLEVTEAELALARTELLSLRTLR